MKKLNKKGFTLVELVIVIAVIAVLAAVLIPTFSSVIKNSHKTALSVDSGKLYGAIIAEGGDFDSWCKDEKNNTGKNYKIGELTVGDYKGNFNQYFIGQVYKTVTNNSGVKYTLEKTSAEGEVEDYIIIVKSNEFMVVIDDAGAGEPQEGDITKIISELTEAPANS